LRSNCDDEPRILADAREDEWEPDEEVRGTEAALRAAGSEVTFYTYPGVGHWYFEEDRRGYYDAEAARLA
jgi:dienelactone hydrolase